ncbi:hypothetical protein C5167_015726 [Papaver somniferum]|uniref:Uncharacterized protein n=1 Tax=Papaver somniferum TaxID=3469 RepID=A0A4Y7JAR3_PAPSO|nr:hypothetical protein C5167_015726 [Papaver somniferum]
MEEVSVREIANHKLLLKTRVIQQIKKKKRKKNKRKKNKMLGLSGIGNKILVSLSFLPLINDPCLEGFK